jgi:hypothetical protein
VCDTTASRSTRRLPLCSTACSPGPGEERTRDALRSPAEHAAAARLIAAGLLEEKAGVLWSTQRAEATFAAT